MNFTAQAKGRLFVLTMLTLWAASVLYAVFVIGLR